MEQSIPIRKRNPDSIALQVIVGDLKNRDTGELSPEITAWKDKLIQRAEHALAAHDAEINQSDIAESCAMLTKLIDSENEAKLAGDKHKEQVADLEQKLEVASTELNEHHYHMNIGDWLAAIIKAAKSCEGKIVKDAKKKRKDELVAGGMSKKNAKKKAKSEVAQKGKFWALKGYAADSAHVSLERELSLVKKWQADGQPAGSEPETPRLDRLKNVSEKAGIPRPFLLKVIRNYSERNQMAHHPPPRLEDRHNVVDWDGISDKCVSARRVVKKDFQDGKISEDRRNYFLEVINAWEKFHNRSQRPGSGKVRAVGNAKEWRDNQNVSRTKALKREAKLVVPPSPYEKGKWDDLDLSE